MGPRMKVKQTALVRIDDELDVPQVLNELHVCCEDVIDAAHNVDVVDKCVDTNTSAECWIRCQRVDGRLEIQQNKRVLSGSPCRTPLADGMKRSSLTAPLHCGMSTVGCEYAQCTSRCSELS